MNYKILEINAGQVKKVTTGAKPYVDTILADAEPNKDLSHKDEYYLVVSVLIEYAGQRGTVVDETSFKVMEATYDADNFCTGVTKETLPTESEIIAKANEAAVKYVKHVDFRDQIRAINESTRNIVDTYNLPKEGLKPGIGI